MLANQENIEIADFAARPLKTILDSTEIGLAIIGKDSQISFYNHAITQLLQNDTDQAIDSGWILKTLQMNQDQLSRISRTIRKSGSWQRTYAHSGRSLIIKALPLQSLLSETKTDQESYEILLQVSDFSNEFQELEALAEQTFLTKQSEKMKSDILAEMSHEFRTPLNAILGFSELMVSDTAMTSEHRDNLNEIIVASKKLLYSLNDLIQISRTDDKKIPLNYEKTDLDEVFQDCISVLSPFADINKINLIFNNSAINVVTDRVRLKQILINLLNNAIKYNKPGGFVLLDAEIDAEQVKIRVIDTGKGIYPSEKSILFSPFGQLINGSRGNDSIGLGLMIAKKLCHFLDGNIEMVSHKGMGSVFWINLPLNSIDGNTTDTTNSSIGKRSVKQFIWIENNRESLTFCKDLEKLYPDIECNGLLTIDEIKNIEVNPYSLIVLKITAAEDAKEKYESFLEIAEKSGKLPKSKLKEISVLVVENDKRIRNIYGKGISRKDVIPGVEFTLFVLEKLLN